LIATLSVITTAAIRASSAKATCVRFLAELPSVSLIAESFFFLLVAAFSHVYPLIKQPTSERHLLSAQKPSLRDKLVEH